MKDNYKYNYVESRPKRKIHARDDLFMPDACEKCGHPLTNSTPRYHFCEMCRDQNAIDDAAQGLKDLVRELEAS